MLTMLSTLLLLTMLSMLSMPTVLTMLSMLGNADNAGNASNADSADSADSADNADGRPQVFSGYLCDRYFRSPVPLVAVLDALKTLGQLDALFADMAQKLREEVIAPLLSPRHVPPPKVSIFSRRCCVGCDTQPRMHICLRVEIG